MSTSSPPTRRRTQRERSEKTVEVLLDAARRCFAERGFLETSLEAVATEAGVTKGALYHHFESKQSLFRAVYEREQRRLRRLSRDAFAHKRDPLEGFYAGCRAFLEASLDPSVQRITLLDAPAALGWETMRQIETAGCLWIMVDGLRLAMDAGRIEQRPVEPLARLLFGSMCEAAMTSARAENPSAELRRFLKELRRILDAL